MVLEAQRFVSKAAANLTVNCKRKFTDLNETMQYLEIELTEFPDCFTLRLATKFTHNTE